MLLEDVDIVRVYPVSLFVDTEEVRVDLDRVPVGVGVIERERLPRETAREITGDREMEISEEKESAKDSPGMKERAPQMKAKEKQAKRIMNGWAYLKASASAPLLFMKIPLCFIVCLFLHQGLQDSLSRRLQPTLHASPLVLL